MTPAVPPDRSFLRLCSAQFLGAFNDNLYKQLLLLLAAKWLFPGEDLQGVAFAVFSLPFVLFSGFAGDLSEKLSKRRVIVAMKALEIAIMALGIAALQARAWPAMLAVLFLMGTQSALFGPSKYGVIPELVPAPRLLAANSLIATTTFLSIVLGQAIAGPLLDEFGEQLWVSGAVCTLLALAGFWVVLGMRPLPAQQPDLRLPRQPFGSLLTTMRTMARQRHLLRAALLYSLFWFDGGVLNQAVTGLGGDAFLAIGKQENKLLSWLLVTLACSVMLGCTLVPVLARRLSGRRLVLGGAAALLLGQALLLLVGPLPRGEGGYLLAHAALAVAGFGGGALTVPLVTFLQAAPEAGRKGQTFAATNFLNFVLIFAAGIFYLAGSALHVPPAAMATASGLVLLLALLLPGSRRWLAELPAAHRPNGGALAVQPIGAQPIAAQPIAAQPVASQPSATQPHATQPIAPQPIAAQPIEPQPIAKQPLETPPIETQPLETPPIETPPIETQPFETQPPQPAAQDQPRPARPVSGLRQAQGASDDAYRHPDPDAGSEDALLQQLAAAFGAAVPARPARGSVVELSDDGALLEPDELSAALRAAAASPPAAPTSVLQAALAQACAHPGPVSLCASPQAARTELVQLAAARPGHWLLLGGVAAADGPRVQRLPWPPGPRNGSIGSGLPDEAVDMGDADAAFDAALAGAALLLLEPEQPPAALQSLLQRAAAAGVPVAFDETRTAFRAAAGPVAATLPQPPQYVLLGPALAAGLPFAVLVGGRGGSDVDPVTAAVAAAALAQLQRQPLQAALQAATAELCRATERAAAVHDIRLQWRGHPALPRLAFAGQEEVEPALFDEHFARELLLRGHRLDGPLLLPAPLRRRGTGTAAAAIAETLLRLRALLVERHSYLSGGLAWTFAGGAPLLRQRGLTRYRFPARAEVDVDPIEHGIRIAFAAGELGPVTSSGFYVPTRLCGDIDLRVRYRLLAFAAGPDASCLGLFLQNEASTARYYAQLISSAEAPEVRSAAAGFDGGLAGRRAAVHDHGWLRLCRRGGDLLAFHRDGDGGDWQLLSTTAAVADTLVAGAKIWSKQHTAGLAAELTQLTIEAELHAEQPPLLPERADPRRR